MRNGGLVAKLAQVTSPNVEEVSFEIRCDVAECSEAFDLEQTDIVLSRGSYDKLKKCYLSTQA
jgi:hypothetical protein